MVNASLTLLNVADVMWRLLCVKESSAEMLKIVEEKNVERNFLRLLSTIHLEIIFYISSIFSIVSLDQIRDNVDYDDGSD